jgi:uncharacterized membrane protein HdeD (DUF308 family)
MKLPFSKNQFMEVFEKYNTAVFPMQILFLLAGCIMLFFVFKKGEKQNKIIGYMLGGIWLWMGIVYHIIFFFSINKAAFLFGAAFIVQGILFCIFAYRNQLHFEFRKSASNWISLFIILFGLIFYPFIGYMLGNSFVHTISFGLPCPTTIFTFGLLGLQRGNLKRRYMIIPLVWSFIGFFAAILMGVYQDVIMPIAALYVFIACHRSQFKKVSASE